MATEQVQTVSTGVDKAKLAMSILLVFAGIAGFYALSKQGVLVQWAALLAALVLAIAAFASSELGREFVAYGRDSWREAKKVVWPTRKEAIQMTGYVFAFVIVMSIFLFSTDKLLEWLVFDLFLGWRK